MFIGVRSAIVAFKSTDYKGHIGVFDICSVELPNDAVSDTTDDDSSTPAHPKKIPNLYVWNSSKPVL